MEFLRTAKRKLSHAKISTIQIKSLRKTFDQQTILNGIDLTVAPGKTVVVFGRSGTGKSVLLKLLIGLIKPDSGSIRIEGDEITRMTTADLNEIRKRIGFLFQYTTLYDSLTVEENVALPLIWHGNLTSGQRKERVANLLSRVGMQDAAGKMPSDISDGMKKRVGLARALVLEPRILLLDEPTAGLDPVTASEIHELFRALQTEGKISAVVATHDLHTIQGVSDEVVMLHEGNVIFDGKLEHFVESTQPEVSMFVKQFALARIHV
jgi:phospholipid/cholesterol/gamma-HCH transport system ATP-binding protein